MFFSLMDCLIAVDVEFTARGPAAFYFELITCYLLSLELGSDDVAVAPSIYY